MPLPDSLGNRRNREGIERCAQVAIGIAHLQATRDDSVDPGARDDAELTPQGNRSRESPRRDGHSHAALDDPG
jgi:hypothetical protein